MARPPRSEEYFDPRHREIADSQFNVLRRHEGLTVDKLQSRGAGLLGIELVDRLLPNCVDREVQARALYGLIHWLLGHNLKSTRGDMRRYYLTLINALNIDVAAPFTGYTVPLFVNSTDDDGTDKRPGAVEKRRDDPRDPLYLPGSDKLLLKVQNTDSTNNQQHEIKAWAHLVAILVDGDVELPDHLLEWAGRQASSGLRVHHRLRHSFELFQGRNRELEAARARIASGQPAVITGPGGIGKSQLVYKLVEELLGDVHIAGHINCDADFAEQEYVKFGRAIGAAEDSDWSSETAGIDGAIDATRDFLSASAKPWLLVLDDLTEPSLYGRFVPARCQNGSVLVTSRRANVIPGPPSIHLEVLEPDEAVQLLVDLTGELDSRDAGELADRLGYYPLALSQAGTFCRENGEALARYIERLESGELQFDFFDEGSTLEPYYNKTLGAVWTLSMLQAREECDDVVDIFLAASYLDADGIEEWIVDELFATDGDRALQVLHRFSLISRHDGVFRIHSILARLGRTFDKHYHDSEAAKAALGILHSSLPVYDNGQAETYEYFDGFLLRHFFSWANWMRIEGLPSNDRMETQAFRISHTLGNYYVQTADDLSLGLLLKIKDFVESRLGRHSLANASILAALAELGLLEAGISSSEYLEQAQEVISQLPGDTYLSGITQRVADVHYRLGQYAESQALLDAAFEAYAANLEGEPSEDVLWQFAVMYEDHGDLDKFGLLVRRAVDLALIRQEGRSYLHKMVARNGDVSDSQLSLFFRKAVAAKSLHEHGPTSPRAVEDQRRLAGHFSSLGEHQQAAELLLYVARIYGAELGGPRTYSALADAMRELQRCDGGEDSSLNEVSDGCREFYYDACADLGYESDIPFRFAIVASLCDLQSGDPSSAARTYGLCKAEYEAAGTVSAIGRTLRTAHLQAILGDKLRHMNIDLIWDDLVAEAIAREARPPDEEGG